MARCALEETIEMLLAPTLALQITAAAAREARLARGKSREAVVLDSHKMRVGKRNDRVYSRELLCIAMDFHEDTAWELHSLPVKVFLKGSVDGIEVETGKVVEVKNRRRAVHADSRVPMHDRVQVIDLNPNAFFRY
jgi:hypothetical protein